MKLIGIRGVMLVSKSILSLGVGSFVILRPHKSTQLCTCMPPHMSMNVITRAHTRTHTPLPRQTDVSVALVHSTSMSLHMPTHGYRHMPIHMLVHIWIRTPILMPMQIASHSPKRICELHWHARVYTGSISAGLSMQRRSPSTAIVSNKRGSVYSVTNAILYINNKSTSVQRPNCKNIKCFEGTRVALEKDCKRYHAQP